MLFLSFSECAAWCRQRGYPLVEADHYGRPAPAVEEHFELIELRYPTDSGDKVRLMRDVLEWFDSSDGLLLWIGEWGVFPRSEHMPLWTRFREAFGERRPLIEAPGHLIAADELADGISVLVTASLFFWDCHVFPSVRGPVFLCSHDEWNGFFVPPGYDTGRIAETFSAWLPKSAEKPVSH